jgi:hypothetical protein
MGTLINASLDVSKITKSKIKDGRWLNVTISINDETGTYGHNTGVYESLSKDERDAGEKRNYIGNGKVVWTDGTIVVADKKEKEDEVAPTQENLPF